MAGSKMLIGVVISVLAVGIISEGSSAQQKHGVKRIISQPNAEASALESVTASEVEYVEGPLAPLYDFLIQRRLFKFCKLLRDSGLDQEIRDIGAHWTVFAPTDSSFYFLPGGTLEEVQKNPQLLRDFLLYHFVSGDFSSDQIQNEMLVDSVQGAPLRFNIYGQIVTVSGAQIIEPDLAFDLGRLYIVDRPLYPLPSVDIVGYLQSNYKELYKLLVDVNLIDYISSGTFTLLVPEDEAFDYLSLELKDVIASNISVAERILLNHILPGSVFAGGIVNGLQWETVGGGVITFTTRRGLTFANDIPIILPDVPLTNGVIHVLNRVLLPEGIDADCNCKPSSETKQNSGSHTPGSSRPSGGHNQRPQHGQGPVTQRPGQPFQRQTPRPASGTSGQSRPVGLDQFLPGRPLTPAPPGNSGNRPWSPTRTVQTVKPFPVPNQVTRSPYLPPPVGPQSDDDSNSVIVNGRQPDAVQKRPDQARTTRHPLPPRRQNINTQTTRTIESGSYPAADNVNYPEEQDISLGNTQTRQTDRWTNRQRTQAPRHPPTQRGSYQTPTTRRPHTTRTYDWNQRRSTFEQPNPDTGVNPSTLNPEQVPTHRPSVQTTSWQQRKQITKSPTQRTTFKPSRHTPQPQRRPTATRSPYVTPVAPDKIPSNGQPFEPRRQESTCRVQGDRITVANRNLPVCPDSEPIGCQKAPYNPADARPLCPESVKPDCRDPNSPFDPSDNRPLCQSTLTNQNCREIGQPTYVGDRRPSCPTSIAPQTECKDPTSQYNPSDRRPVCRTNSPGTDVSLTGDVNSPQGCRRPDEIINPQDQRPICPDEPQEDCRSFLDRPRPGDTRPVCKINRQVPKPHKDGIKEQNKHVKPQQPTQTTRRQSWQSTTRAPQSWQSTSRAPQSWQSTTRTPQSWQTSRSPHNSQTTRSPQSWQTTRSPPSWQTTTIRQPNVKQPQAGGIQSPTQPHRDSFLTNPQTESFQPQPDLISPPETGSYPSGPQSELNPNQPQTGTHGSQPQTGRHPWQPQSGTHQSQPNTGSYPSPPDSGSYPSAPNSGSYPSQPGSYPPRSQPGRYPTQPPLPPISQPHSGSQPRQPIPGAHQTRPQLGTQPQSGDHASKPHSGVQPSQPQHSGPSEPQSGQGPFQPGRTTTGYPQRRPGSQSRFTTQRPTQGVSFPGSGDVRPDQAPQGGPVSGQGHQSGSFTLSPRKPVTTTTRVPISVTGTSTTPGEDSRRTLYEIVEDPALLIRGRPIKLTKIFALFHKAGLQDILLSPGPTTVFLPSDDAFSALPQGVVEQLEENPELLRQVLSYHITKSEILPSPQGESYAVPSLEGTQLVITMLNGGRLILISGAKAVAVTRANNGIFYVINQLLYPLPHHDIVGAIQSRPDLSTLAWLLPQSGLVELLQGETPYTLLAPTDNAFAQLSPVAYEELTRNATALREILLNHVIEGAHYGREFFTGGTFPSARGGKLKFQVVSYGYQVNEVNIKTPEIVTGTGVIHLVDQVILEDSDLRFFTSLENSAVGEDGSLTSGQQPPGGGPQQGISLVIPGAHQPGAGQPQVGGLLPSVGEPSTVGRLPSHGQGVPGHRRTHGQPQSPGQIFGNQPQINGQTIPGQQIPGRPAQGHAVGRQQPSHGGGQPAYGQPQSHGTGGACVGCNQPASQPGRQTPGHSSFGGPRTQVGSVVGQRQPATQTGSHAVSGGHQGQGAVQGGGQPNDVADLARNMGLNQFANWISNTGLLEKVHDGGVYTVFAPTDDAVNSLPEDMVHSIESNPEQVKSILQYHIIPQRVNLNSVTNEETTSTLLQGKTIRFNVYQNAQPDCKQLVTASGTPVGEALATMGSIQVIPVAQVLYQPTGNLLRIVEASPILQKLNEAVKAARLTWVLSGTGPVTIFSPSDTAFNSLTEEQRKTLIEDKQAFSDLLKRHMVRGTLFSSGVQDDVEKKSENNKPIKLSLQEGVLTVNSIPVTYADITATNGVLHVIDHFL